MSLASLPQEWAFAAWAVEIGNGPVGALCRMMAWSAGEGTHGYVPSQLAMSIATKSELEALLRKGHLVTVAAQEVQEATGRIAHRENERVVMPSDGYFLPDYLVYTQTEVEKERNRRQHSEAGKRGAKKRWADSGRSSGSNSGRHESDGGRHSGPSSCSSSPPSTTERRSTGTVDEALTTTAASCTESDTYPGTPDESDPGLDELVELVLGKDAGQ